MVFEKEQTEAVGVWNAEVVNMVNMNTRRIRALEQRLTVTERMINALEEKIIEEMNNLRRTFEQISIDIKAATESISQIRTEILTINKNLDKTARKSEVRELEGLLDLYSPIKSKFATRDEIERLIEEKISKKT